MHPPLPRTAAVLCIAGTAGWLSAATPIEQRGQPVCIAALVQPAWLANLRHRADPLSHVQTPPSPAALRAPAALSLLRIRLRTLRSNEGRGPSHSTRGGTIGETVRFDTGLPSQQRVFG